VHHYIFFGVFRSETIINLTKKNKMKTLKFISNLIICLGLTACTNAQIWSTVRGEGSVVTEERSASYFSELVVSSGIDVYLKQGDKESITVEAEQNLHEYIKTEVKDNVLHVFTAPNINIRFGTRKVYVTMKDISSVKTSSAGDVTGMTPINTTNLKLSTNSAGDIKLEVNASDINVDISSAGNITLSGIANVLNADLSSAGDLEGYDLKVKEADISVSSAGGARVYVTEKLTARSSSAGDIYYAGNPEFVDAHSSSAGGVHKR
jgi:hypothetical protein